MQINGAKVLFLLLGVVAVVVLWWKRLYIYFWYIELLLLSEHAGHPVYRIPLALYDMP